MRSLISFLVLFSAAMSAYAGPGQLPEPETLALIAIGAAGMLINSRKKK
jgi:hypothetical protein